MNIGQQCRLKLQQQVFSSTTTYPSYVYLGFLIGTRWDHLGLLVKQEWRPCKWIVSKKLKFNNCHDVNRNGLWGGLALLCDLNMTVNVTSYSSYHINVEFQIKNRKKWKCTWMYGHLKIAQKKFTQTLLRRLLNLSSLTWICLGDF